MKYQSNLLLIAALSLGAATFSPAATITVYDNLGTAATAGYSELNSGNPIFGDSLTLASGGTLAEVGVSLFNSTSGGNTGAIMTGSMVLNFYDNTALYASGTLGNPLLGSTTVTWDFTTDGGLAPGYFATEVFDVSGLGLVLPQEILITQQFTQTAGTSTRNGLVLFSNPVTGTSPNTIYIKSATTPEGLYTFTGNPGQVGYTVTIVPEPGSMLLAGLGLAGWMILRRRQ